MVLTRLKVRASKDYTPGTGVSTAESTRQASPIPLTTRVRHNSGQRNGRAVVRLWQGNGMIAAALIREQEHAYGKGMATGHAGTDIEEPAEDEASDKRQPSQQGRGKSAG